MKLLDPRSSVIDKRLRHIRRIIAVTSGKGGVGKSMIATTFALTMAKSRLKVGLFDLDFTSPSTHLIMGAKNVMPIEEKGIIPPIFNDIMYMSLVFYSGEFATPLRGVDVSNALIELLSVTQWGKLDVLVIDMPPGIGDVLLDLIRLVKKIEFLVVTTSSQIAFNTVKKQIKLLRELKVKTIGVVENMKVNKKKTIQAETEKLGLQFLGEIPYDRTLEESIGDCDKLLSTNFFKMVTATLLKNGI
jgi:ATP-binding protein involved in chromosome partitioning